MNLQVSPLIKKSVLFPLRNLVFFSGVCFVFYEVAPFFLNKLGLLSGALVFVVGYQAVYLINDYFDRDYDEKLHRPYNLYLILKNRRIFWFLLALFLTIGIIISFLISFSTLVFYLLLVGVNYLYSAPPFRLKGVLPLRGVTLGVIYSLKGILVASFFNFPLGLIPKFLFLFVFCLLGFVNSIRKYYEGKIQKIEALIFGFLLFLVVPIGILLVPFKVWLATLIMAVVSIGRFRKVLFPSWQHAE